MCHFQMYMAFTYCDYKAREHRKSESDTHVQTDMALTCYDYKAKEHGKSESDVPCSNRHDTDIL